MKYLFLLLTYNAQNLFDTFDDAKTRDETFLPLKLKQNDAHRKKCNVGQFGSRRWECLFLDWSEDRLVAKMAALAKRIKSMGQPDFILLEEIENRAVVERFRDLHFKGYSVGHHESKDPRGIETAILSRLPIERTIYHEVRLPDKELRGILEVIIKLKDRKLHLLAMHLPSQAAKFYEREAVLTELNKIATALPTGDVVVAGGDVNITAKELEKQSVVENYWSDIWAYANKDECPGCVGTYYYKPKKEWSFFDVLLLRKDRQSAVRWHWKKNSARVGSYKSETSPPGFDPILKTGDSDHWPFAAELVIAPHSEATD